MRPEAILARNLKRLRAVRGFSQEALAHEAGLNRTYLSDVENERNSISLRKLAALAAVLKVQASDLIDEEYEP